MTTATVIALVSLLAVIASFIYLRLRVQEIHVLVNRRLEVALQENRDLKEKADRIHQ